MNRINMRLFLFFFCLRLVALGIYNLQVIKSQLEDDAFYECQVGPTEKSTGIISRRGQLTVLGKYSWSHATLGRSLELNFD